jgi:transposase
VSGAFEDSALVGKGWASDRRVARQVRTLQASTPDGTVLYSRPDPGNAAELTLVGASLERLLAISGPGLLIVCDSAMGQPKTMREIDQAGVRFVVPLRASAGFRERFLTDAGHGALRPVKYLPEREAKLPAKRRTVFKGALRDWEIPASDTLPSLRLRVAYIHSSEEATQVADARERALVKAEDALERMRNGLGGRYYKTQEQVQRRIGQIIGVNITGLIDATVTATEDKLTVTWQRNQDAIATAKSFDGIYALATNLPGPITAGQVLRLYKDQQIVERRHRDLKQTLKVRPIFLHNDDRVHALLSIVGISLLIFGLIEAQTRAALGDTQQLPGLLPEGRAAKPTGRNILAAFQGLGLTYTHTGIQLDRLTDTQQQILQLLGIQPPWPQQANLALTNCGKWG